MMSASCSLIYLRKYQIILLRYVLLKGLKFISNCSYSGSALPSKIKPLVCGYFAYHKSKDLRQCSAYL